MPNTSILFGVILLLVGIAGYIHGISTEKASLTALIPAAFGLLLVIFGAVSKAKESLTKHMMHAAAAVAFLGVIATSGRLIPRLGELTLSAAVLSQVAMFVVCLAFVLLAVRSFAQARKNR
ncbi:MAG TPA: hypothetical protein PLN05_03790 [Pyrinomonadaceae bacterium]|nr:hypothetical protein [Chloracidobacterium sp.]HRJ87188.1 hypothetical protein [Pyrinomonadaceae bacterium]HRK49543.1 hypothetical protein [Pyrinomonadaceae bacterium]